MWGNLYSSRSFLIFNIYIWYVLSRELYGAVYSDSLFRLRQCSYERWLRHQLPTVTLLDSSTHPPSLSFEWISLLWPTSILCNILGEQNFDEMIFEKLWYSETSNQPTTTANIIWRKKKMLSTTFLLIFCGQNKSDSHRLSTICGDRFWPQSMIHLRSRSNGPLIRTPQLVEIVWDQDRTRSESDLHKLCHHTAYCPLVPL